MIEVDSQASCFDLAPRDALVKFEANATLMRTAVRGALSVPSRKLIVLRRGERSRSEAASGRARISGESGPGHGNPPPLEGVGWLGCRLAAPGWLVRLVGCRGRGGLVGCFPGSERRAKFAGFSFNPACSASVEIAAGRVSVSASIPAADSTIQPTFPPTPASPGGVGWLLLVAGMAPEGWLVALEQPTNQGVVRGG